MNTLVTVSIPTYKRSTWLGRAIQSVFNQSHTNWELIIVDDNGDNEFREQTRTAIADVLADPRVSYLTHDQNQGLAAARNTGIFAARGEFIAFLDDDDEWLPHKLEKQVGVFEGGSSRLGLVYSAWWAIDERTGEKRLKTPRLRGDVHHKLGINHIGPPSQVMCRTEPLRKIGGFDASFRARDDIEMYFRLSKHCDFDYVEEPLLNYYIHAGAMSQANPHKIGAYHKFLEKHADDLQGRHKVLGEIYEALGDAHIKHGQRALGLQSLFKSYLHDPTSLGRVAKFALLASGLDVYQRAKRSVARAKQRYRALVPRSGQDLGRYS